MDIICLCKRQNNDVLIKKKKNQYYNCYICFLFDALKNYCSSRLRVSVNLTNFLDNQIDDCDICVIYHSM